MCSVKHLLQSLALLPALALHAPAFAQEAITDVVPVIIPHDDMAYPAGVPSVPAVVSQCMICHGPTGVTQIPEWPNIAGQKKDYLLKQLQLFHAGERPDPHGMMMPIMKLLSPEDLEVAAEYFSAQTAAKWDAPAEAPDEVIELAETCAGCHNGDAEGDAAAYPLIEGQKRAYLQEQLLAFRDGKRANDLMSGIAETLTDEQIVQISDYLAHRVVPASTK